MVAMVAMVILFIYSCNSNGGLNNILLICVQPSRANIYILFIFPTLALFCCLSKANNSYLSWGKCNNSINQYEFSSGLVLTNQLCPSRCIWTIDNCIILNHEF